MRLADFTSLDKARVRHRLSPGSIDVMFDRMPFQFASILKPKEIDMAKGQQRSNREAKKPKKKKIKVIAAAPSQGAGWQPTLAEGKRK